MLADELLTGAKGAAAFIGVNERAICHLVRKGRLPVVRMGRRLYFRRTEIERAFSCRPGGDAA